MDKPCIVRVEATTYGDIPYWLVTVSDKRQWYLMKEGRPDELAAYMTVLDILDKEQTNGTYHGKKIEEG
jgi:hypothetical protein